MTTSRPNAMERKCVRVGPPQARNGRPSPACSGRHASASSPRHRGADSHKTFWGVPVPIAASGTLKRCSTRRARAKCCTPLGSGARSVGTARRPSPTTAACCSRRATAAPPRGTHRTFTTTTRAVVVRCARCVAARGLLVKIVVLTLAALARHARPSDHSVRAALGVGTCALAAGSVLCGYLTAALLARTCGSTSLVKAAATRARRSRMTSTLR